MKHRASLAACLLIAAVLIGYRSYYSDIGGARKGLIITQWDAFGYYLYLPAITIYGDYKKLEWATSVDKRYNVTGGGAMPSVKLDNGNNVSKYLGGVALLQAPLFVAAHLYAKAAGYPADGFSAPYQYALSFGAILYCCLALLLLRRIFLRWFRDDVVALTLLLLCLATNFIQYAAVDNGLSHGWIFPLYVLLLNATIRWHEKPAALLAFAIGWLIGLAAICRPTEAIALFIPLLWNLHTKEASREKWKIVGAHKWHIAFAVLGGLIGILPQLIYWKAVTGSFVYDVGSKWVFLNPWWRVLAGWEKGWFIYTPVTLLFVAGLLFIKRFPFGKAALAFCLLNIWIIISWDEWQYGASYSTRALVQSYPVFALPLAAVVTRVQAHRWRYALWIAGIYLIGVNFFQTVQYNSTILHYSDMNRRYYGRIYLNPLPSALDMSLMDTEDWLNNEANFDAETLHLLHQPKQISFAGNTSAILADTALSLHSDVWLRINARIDAPGHLWQSHLTAELRNSDSAKRTSIRLFNPVGVRSGEYAFYMMAPAYFHNARLKIFLSSDFEFRGVVQALNITVLRHR